MPQFILAACLLAAQSAEPPKSSEEPARVNQAVPEENRPPMNQPARPSANRESPGLPDLPRAITSFGAAVLGDAATAGEVYVYGGHFGAAHHYSQAGQSNHLLRLDFDKPDRWQSLAPGPKLQGLALVAHDGRLYRAGGFTARNAEKEEQDLWSVADFARYDPRSNKWEPLPPMPRPRSSFDAVVLCDTLYVVGGWNMRGGEETQWCDTAWAVDLSQRPLKWRELPRPGFQRRALSLGVADGRVVVVGGMQPDGKVASSTACYDPAAERWSDGPELPAGEMEGFGTDCCTLGGRLYVSTISGKLLRLSPDRDKWELVKQLDEHRFFHRMVPRAGRLVMLGGASMTTGKFAVTTEVAPTQ